MYVLFLKHVVMKLPECPIGMTSEFLQHELLVNYHKKYHVLLFVFFNTPQHYSESYIQCAAVAFNQTWRIHLCYCGVNE